jgi:hypothetical protein
MQVDHPSHDEFDDLMRAHDKVNNGGHGGDGLSINGKDVQLSIVVVETQETKQNIHMRQTNTTRDNNITRDNNNSTQHEREETKYFDENSQKPHAEKCRACHRKTTMFV